MTKNVKNKKRMKIRISIFDYFRNKTQVQEPSSICILYKGDLVSHLS